MTQVRIELHIPAFNEYRNDSSVVAAMEAIANGIKGRADGGILHHRFPDEEAFKVETVHNSSRAVTFVRTNSFDGELAEATHRTFSRAIG